MSFHTRSISLPSSPQRITLNFQEELSYVNTMLVSSESAMTSQLVLDGLSRLSNLYDLTEEFLHLPKSQQISSISHQKKCVEDDLDMSIRVLDLCSSIQDIVVESNVRNQVKGTTRKSKLETKKVQKKIKYCLKSVKKIDIKDKDCVFLMLTKTREVTFNLFRIVLSFISEPKDSKWSFVSKVVQRNSVASIHSNLVHVENELECLFRRLMQNRVSLLNIISL